MDGDFLNPRVLDRALDLARKAVELDRNLPQAHAALGLVLTWKHRHDDSVAAFERATALNPNYVDWRFGFALIYAGASKRAIDVVQANMRLDPFYPPLATFVLAFAHYMIKQHAQALSLLRDYVAEVPTFRAGHGLLAATYAQLGQIEEALRTSFGFTSRRVGAGDTVRIRQEGVGARVARVDGKRLLQQTPRFVEVLHPELRAECGERIEGAAAVMQAEDPAGRKRSSLASYL